MAAYSECWRVLRSGGTVCTVTDSESIIRRRVPQSLSFPETVDKELTRYPRISELRAAMTEAGFDIGEQKDVEHIFPLDDLVPYERRVFSSLQLISDEAFERGLRCLRE